MGRPGREAVMTALFNALVASVQTSFTADLIAGSPILSSPSTTAGLFIGLPVFGGTIPTGSVIAALAPLTLSIAPTANGPATSLTTGFLTFSRRFKHWSLVPSQPALFLRDGDEDLEFNQIIIQRQTINCEVWIYTTAGNDPNAVPAIALNNLLDAVQSVFAPDDRQSNRFTLGGLVEWCRLAGKILKEPGDMAGQAIAVADVEITVP